MENSCRFLAPGRGAVKFTHDLDVSPCSSFRLELVHVNLSGHFDVPQMIKGQILSVSLFRHEHYFPICVLQLSPDNKMNGNEYVQIWRAKCGWITLFWDEGNVLCNVGRLGVLLLLAAFTQSRKTAVSFSMSLCQSAMYHCGSHWTDLRDVWYWELYESLPTNFKCGQKHWTLYMETKAPFIIGGDFESHKTFLCNTRYFRIVNSDI